MLMVRLVGQPSRLFASCCSVEVVKGAGGPLSTSLSLHDITCNHIPRPCVVGLSKAQLQHDSKRPPRRRLPVLHESLPAHIEILWHLNMRFARTLAVRPNLTVQREDWCNTVHYVWQSQQDKNPLRASIHAPVCNPRQPQSSDSGILRQR